MQTRGEGPRRLYGRWVLACTAGELVGFAIPVLFGFLLARALGESGKAEELGPRLAVLAGMVVAGALEGAAIGFFQWRVLRRRFERLRARAWVGATAGVVALGWFLGMLPEALLGKRGEAAEPSLSVVLLFALLFGALAGMLFGGAQWLVLRRHAEEARLWIGANAIGWALALPWSYLAASGYAASRSLPLALLAGAAAGGLTIAAVTGAFLSILSPKPEAALP